MNFTWKHSPVPDTGCPNWKSIFLGLMTLIQKEIKLVSACHETKWVFSFQQKSARFLGILRTEDFFQNQFILGSLFPDKKPVILFMDISCGECVCKEPCLLWDLIFLRTVFWYIIKLFWSQCKFTVQIHYFMIKFRNKLLSQRVQCWNTWFSHLANHTT